MPADLGIALLGVVAAIGRIIRATFPSLISRDRPGKDSALITHNITAPLGGVVTTEENLLQIVIVIAESAAQKLHIHMTEMDMDSYRGMDYRSTNGGGGGICL